MREFARDRRGIDRDRIAPLLLPALLFPAVELLGVTEFGLVNSLLLSVAFVVFTVLFQRATGGW